MYKASDDVPHNIYPSIHSKRRLQPTDDQTAYLTPSGRTQANGEYSQKPRMGLREVS